MLNISLHPLNKNSGNMKIHNVLIIKYQAKIERAI